MQIFVKSTNGRTNAVDVDGSHTVEELKARVQSEEGVAVEQQHLTFNGRSLGAGKTLSEEGVTASGVVELSLRVRGGHCQVPCGIFDDPKFVSELRECATTIRKAMTQIAEIHSKGDITPLDFNQMTRWVNVKEEHCGKIISLVAEYSLCQRVKTEGVFASDKDYVDALKAHHALMQAAMKAKQQVDLKFADALEHCVGDCCKMYEK